MTTLSYRGMLLRGIAAGGGAGLAGGIVGLFVVEPAIRAALAVEEARSAGAAEEGHEELFSRPVQVLGGVAAAVVVGLALGVVFATVLAATAHRRPDRAPFQRSLYAAAIGFAAVGLLPALKYPANPPGVGDPETVNQRTLGYLTLIAAGFALAYGVGRLHSALVEKGTWSPALRTTAVAAAGVAGAVVILLVWPGTPDSVPADIGADLLWRFRLASLAEVAAMWTVLGFAFGLLTEARARKPVVTTV